MKITRIILVSSFPDYVLFIRADGTKRVYHQPGCIVRAISLIPEDKIKTTVSYYVGFSYRIEIEF